MSDPIESKLTNYGVLMSDSKLKFEDVFNDHALSDFLDVEYQLLIEEMLTHPSATLLFAPSGGMKSLFSLHLAATIATGGKFLNKQALKLPVVYVDGEMSALSISKRVKEFGIGNIPKSQLCYITNANQNIDFSEDKKRDVFIEWIKSKGYRFVVLDNIRTLLTLESESDAAGFSEFNNFVRALRDAGCSVLVVHHSNKSTNEEGNVTYAGSSNLTTIYDQVIGLQTESNNDLTKRLTIEKNRDGMQALAQLNDQRVTFREGAFHLDSGTSSDIVLVGGELLDKVADLELTNKQEILDWLETKSIKVPSNRGGNRTLDSIYEHIFEDNFLFNGAADSLSGFRKFVTIASKAKRATDKQKKEKLKQQLRELNK